ncbi:hypothetical protein AB0933_32565 [Streptomyces venezuelae]|uniref:hypothetical protein n=1 Tax=Streptomyces venezuelae TaxID=54571 RepID=UPI0034555092
MNTPTDPTADPRAGHDQALAERAADSGQWLAGLIATAMLDTAGRPAKLPEYLFADLGLPADVIDRIWQRALAVGYRAGQLAARPRLHRDTLARLQTDLATAGYHAMARHTARTLNTLGPDPRQHPADADPHARGDHG